MNIVTEKRLMLRKVSQCAENDVYLMHHVDDIEEFEFYSDTSKVISNLADKYSLTLEELDELWNYYDNFKQYFKKIYRKGESIQ